MNSRLLLIVSLTCLLISCQVENPVRSKCFNTKANDPSNPFYSIYTAIEQAIPYSKSHDRFYVSFRNVYDKQGENYVVMFYSAYHSDSGSTGPQYSPLNGLYKCDGTPICNYDFMSPSFDVTNKAECDTLISTFEFGEVIFDTLLLRE